MPRRITISICLLLLLASAPVFGRSDAASGDSLEPVSIYLIPVVKYVMASPRACLIGPAPVKTDVYRRPVGGAENFARADGAIRVPVGTRVVFCLSHEMEGVWFDGSYGRLGTSLVLQWCRACKLDDCERAEFEAHRDGSSAAEQAQAGEVVPCPWVTIGKDGAKDLRRGPSIGHAKVGVPVRFRKPGIYYLRGIVSTHAQPLYPLAAEQLRNQFSDADKVLPWIPSAVDTDIVYVRVRVVDLPEAEAEPEQQVLDDPDVMYTRPMPRDVSPESMSQDENELSEYELVDLVDAEVFVQEWGPDYDIPLGQE